MRPALEKELTRYPDIVVDNPTDHAGRWDMGRFSKVKVDYGCGLGDYLVGIAGGEPDTLFVGIDSELFCIVETARRIRKAGLGNMRAVHTRDTPLDVMFGVGEVDEIFVNFPTPHPRGRDAGLRMTNYDYLLVYRHILASDGKLRLKTDSAPFLGYTLLELERAGFEVTWRSDDAARDLPMEPRTGYECMLGERGARVLAIEAMALHEPDGMREVPPASLYDYLPDDLESLAYIPKDMERSVRNMIEARSRVREAHERKRLRPERASGELDLECGVAYAYLHGWLAASGSEVAEGRYVFRKGASVCRASLTKLEPRQVGVVTLPRTALHIEGDQPAVDALHREFIYRFLSAGG